MKPFLLWLWAPYRAMPKSACLLYRILQILTVLCAVWQASTGNVYKVMLCALSLLLWLLPAVVASLFKVKLPTVLVVVTWLFIFSAEIFGGVLNFYTLIPHWDTALHITTGFFAAGVGLSLVGLSGGATAKMTVNPLFAAVVALCFSMTVGVAWEFFEYGCDRVLGTDMQKDRIVKAVGTVELDPEKSNTVVRIDDVEQTVLYDAAGRELARIKGGYLDVGVTDTMKDMGANLLGAVVFSALGYAYYYKREEYGFVGTFLIRPQTVSLSVKTKEE